MEFTLKFKVLILGIVVFLTTFLLALFVSRYVLPGKASGTDVIVTVAPETGSIEGTKEVNIAILAPTGSKISAFNLGLKTTGSISVHDNRDPAGFTPLIDKSKVRVAYGSLKGDTDLPTEVLVPIILKCDSVGSGTFTIDTSSPSQVVGTVAGSEFSFGTANTGSYTCTKADAGGGSGTPVGISAHFTPVSATIAAGQTSTTNFIIDGFTSGQKVSGFDVTLQSLPTVQLAVTQTALTPDGSCQLAVNTWDGATGTLRLVGICKNTTLLDSVLLPVTIKVPATLTGANKISISKLEVVGPQAPTGYTVSKGEFSYSTTGGTGGTGGGGNTHIILTLRLQGIQAKPKNISSLAFRVGLTNKTMEAPVTQNGTFTVDDKGLFHGNVGFNVPDGGGYCILIKGPMHLQKRICDADASETFPGTYKNDKGAITLKAGDNTFDFSKVYMMSCDLPEQNGICNAYDMSLIRNNLGHSEADALKAADINGDGVVNGTDWALAIASLSIKLDD